MNRTAAHGARFVVGLLCVALAAFTDVRGVTAQTRTSRLPLVKLLDVRLPGGVARFDYQSVDTTNRTLYIAHLGDSALEVVNLDTLHVTGRVTNIGDVHGVAVASDLGRVYATATGTNELVTIDTTTKRVLDRTPTGAFPDGIAYDSDDRLVFVSNKNDGSVTVVDANTSHVTGTIKLADETGNVVYNPAARLVYVAVRTPDALVAIDPTSGDIKTRIHLAGCNGAHGVYIQTQTQQAFVACEQNARLVTVDVARHHQTSRSSVGQAPDVLAFDPALRRLYVASESGTVSVFTTTTRAPTKIGQAHLADAAHTVAVDPTTHRAYFPLPNINDRPVLRVMQPTTDGHPGLPIGARRRVPDRALWARASVAGEGGTEHGRQAADCADVLRGCRRSRLEGGGRVRGAWLRLDRSRNGRGCALT